MSTPSVPPSSADQRNAEKPNLVPVPDIAEALGVIVTQVHQLLRDRVLVAVRVRGVMRIPADFIDAGEVVKGLTATIRLLTDGGYADEEIVTWLFTSEASLPGTPMNALRENRGREVHRRAQTAGF